MQKTSPKLVANLPNDFTIPLNYVTEVVVAGSKDGKTAVSQFDEPSGEVFKYF
jgi:hypothetical protein